MDTVIVSREEGAAGRIPARPVRSTHASETNENEGASKSSPFAHSTDDNGSPGELRLKRTALPEESKDFQGTTAVIADTMAVNPSSTRVFVPPSPLSQSGTRTGSTPFSQCTENTDPSSNWTMATAVFTAAESVRSPRQGESETKSSVFLPAPVSSASAGASAGKSYWMRAPRVELPTATEPERARAADGTWQSIQAMQSMISGLQYQVDHLATTLQTVATAVTATAGTKTRGKTRRAPSSDGSSSDASDILLKPHGDVDLRMREYDARPEHEKWKPYERSFTENSVLFPNIPRHFYQLRWAIMNYSPLTGRFWNGQFTYGEGLACFLIILQMLWITIHWAADADFHRNVRSTGHAASILLMLTYVAALHNNSVLLLALGLPFDRTLPWHKMLAASSIYNSVIHGLAFYLNGRADTMPDAWTNHHIFGLSKAYGMEISGWALLACMVAMSAMALPFVLKAKFTVFFRTHVTFAVATGIMALMHGFGSAVWNGYVPASIPGLLFWALDLFIRFVYMNCLTSTSKATLRLVPGGGERAEPVVEMTFPNTRNKFSAGQWVFICIPKLGLLHWHPFTISSAASDKTVSVHFICSGAWTSEVANLAKKNSSIKAYIEGPYGAPMVDMHGKRYKSFLIISSGLGWTFLRAWKRQLLQDAARGRPVASINTAAVLKDQYRHLAPEFCGWKYGTGATLPKGMRVKEEIYLTGRPPAPLVQVVEDSSDSSEDGASEADSPREHSDVVSLQRSVSRSSTQRTVSKSMLSRSAPLDVARLAHRVVPGVPGNTFVPAAQPSGDYRRMNRSPPKPENPFIMRTHGSDPPGSDPALRCSARSLRSSDRHPAPVAEGSERRGGHYNYSGTVGTVGATPELSLVGMQSHLSLQPYKEKRKESDKGRPDKQLELYTGVEYKYGRPDIEQLFDAAAEEAMAAGEDRVAVLLCVNDHVLNACLREVQDRRGTQVQFDVHYEAFGF